MYKVPIQTLSEKFKRLRLFVFELQYNKKINFV